MIRTDDTQQEVGFIKTKHNSQMANIDNIMTKENGQMVKIFEQGFTREQEATALPMETNTKTIGKDLKQYQIYGNSEQRNLPKEYQEVEYIESTGTQYIDTEYIQKSKPLVEIKFFTSNSNDSDLLGNPQSVPDCFIINFDNLNKNSGIYCRYGSTTAKTYAFEKDSQKNVWHKIIASNNLIYDEQTVITGDEHDFANNIQKIYVLKGRTNFIGRVAYTKIYDNNILVRDFIPCYRKSDNVIGMYDTVNGVFYTNAGTGTFLKGADVVPTPDKPIAIESVGDLLLPSGYQEVEYIETTDTQFIETNLLNSEWHKIKVEFSASNAKEATIIGGDGTQFLYVKEYEVTSYPAPSSASKLLVEQHQIIDATVTSLSSTRIQVELPELTYQSGKFSDTDTKKCYLLAMRKSGGGLYIGKVRLYYCEIYDNNDTLIRNFIPCYRKADNEIGMYDLVNGVFYTNQGTGTFLKGNDVNHYKIPVGVKTKNLYGGIYNTKFTLDNPIPANTAIKFSGDNTSSQCYVAIYDIDNVEITNGRLSSTQSDRRVTTLTPTKDVYYIKFYNTELLNLCVRIDNSVEYVPYFNETTTIYLTEPLRKIGEYADYIDFKNQKVVRKVKNVDLGTFSYDHETLSGARQVFSRTFLDALPQISTSYSLLALSELYRTVSYSDTWTNGVMSYRSSSIGTRYITFMNNNYTTTADFVEGMKNKHFIYVLETPTEESITLPSISTAKGEKSIFDILTKVEPSKLKITYKGE